MKRDHLIPFSKQVKTLLLLLKPITGHHTYIFPRDKHYDKDMPMHAKQLIKLFDALMMASMLGVWSHMALKEWHQSY